MRINAIVRVKILMEDRYDNGVVGEKSESEEMRYLIIHVF